MKAKGNHNRTENPRVAINIPAAMPIGVELNFSSPSRTFTIQIVIGQDILEARCRSTPT